VTNAGVRRPGYKVISKLLHSLPANNMDQFLNFSPQQSLFRMTNNTNDGRNWSRLFSGRSRVELPMELREKRDGQQCSSDEQFLTTVVALISSWSTSWGICRYVDTVCYIYISFLTSSKAPPPLRVAPSSSS